MSDPQSVFMLSTSGLIGLAMVTAAGLSGWRGWLQLRSRQLDARPDTGVAAPNAAQRIEIADLRERIRKLEAIAAGVDL